MKKFVFLYYGMWTPTQEMKDAWGKWFASITDKLVDGGNPFGPGRKNCSSLPHHYQRQSIRSNVNVEPFVFEEVAPAWSYLFIITQIG